MRRVPLGRFCLLDRTSFAGWTEYRLGEMNSAYKVGGNKVGLKNIVELDGMSFVQVKVSSEVSFDRTYFG